MPDNLRELFQHGMPFMVAASSEADKVNPTRIIEAILIAAITGAGAWFMIIPELKTQLKYVSDDVKEVKADIGNVSGELKEIERRVDALSVEVVRDRFTRTDFDNWLRNNRGDD